MNLDIESLRIATQSILLPTTGTLQFANRLFCYSSSGATMHAQSLCHKSNLQDTDFGVCVIISIPNDGPRS
ncbi:hypothetical protein ABKN59_004744 [Abortiporus biennis]